MRRLNKSLVAAALALALIGVSLAAIFWVVATTPGARWLLTTLSPVGGVGFSARQIEGRLSDHLRLSEVKIGLGQQKIEIASLELRWQPLRLLTGTVGIKELTLKGVRIQDDTPGSNEPPTLAWPQIPGNSSQLAVKIAHLLVTDLSYQSRQKPPVLLTSLLAAITWQDRLLTINNLQTSAPGGQISGAVAVGFRQPFLTADLALALSHPLGELDHFSLQARQSPEPGAEPFVGAITIIGQAGKEPQLELRGQVGMAARAINLRQLTLSRPGQKGLLSGEGSLTFPSREAVLALQIKASGLDLAPELKIPTDLSGSLKFTGTLNNYRGEFSITNQGQGWRAAVVSASYRGNGAGLQLAPVKAEILGGSLAGRLDLDWNQGLALRGEINGSNLNPARITREWQGVANFTASGELAWSETNTLTGKVSALLRESRLHGQALTGSLQADFAGGNISLARVDLQGKGFDLHAAGELNQRLTLAARISDFSKLVPDASGTLQSEGWLRWRDQRLSGELSGTGRRLTYGGTKIGGAKLSARLAQGADSPLHLKAELKDLLAEAYKFTSVNLLADGSLAHHTLDATIRAADAEARLALVAGYSGESWSGELSRFSGSDQGGTWSLVAPATFAVSADKFSLTPLSLNSGGAERLEVSADLALKPLAGQVLAQWTDLNLARANAFLKDIQISGSSHGSARIGFLPDKQLSLDANATGSGTFTSQGHTITFFPSQLTCTGNAQGLRVGLDLTSTEGGRLTGSYISTAPLRLAMPESGELTAEVSGIDLGLFQPWLPQGARVEGHLSGKAQGILLPDLRFELEGEARLTGGSLHQARPDGELHFTTSSATANWGWRGEALNANLALTMAEHGQLSARGKLPLSARWPLVVDRRGPLQASLSGQLRENGLLTILFPGLIQESSGELDTDLAVSGSWEEPQFGGQIRLNKAGAYLPTAGIHLSAVQLAASLEKNLIRVDSFRALSGPGHLEGAAQITLDGWQVTGYQGTIAGENFQTVYFPELQILATPKLAFTGTPQKLTLRGELLLPKLQLVGEPSRSAIAPSSDVIREGTVAAATPGSPLALDVQVRVVLGEQVAVKVDGIDTQLGGGVDLSLSSLERITSKGEIKVSKGRYRTYGVNLEIVRGRLYFAGGPINTPTLDFLALRTIGEVRAGVTVTGTLQHPVTKLYSEPAMPDADVLGYIVLGHPLGSSSGEQASLLVQAAGALLSASQAESLQEQLKNRLGLSTLEITGGGGGDTGHMGYKPLAVTPPGAIPTATQPGITETMLTVGKYLTPQLYISYGRSLFTGSNLFRLRYDIDKKWQIETQTGSESGADLFYKLEFK